MLEWFHPMLRVRVFVHGWRSRQGQGRFLAKDGVTNIWPKMPWALQFNGCGPTACCRSGQPFVRRWRKTCGTGEVSFRTSDPAKYFFETDVRRNNPSPPISAPSFPFTLDDARSFVSPLLRPGAGGSLSAPMSATRTTSPASSTTTASRRWPWTGE